MRLKVFDDKYPEVVLPPRFISALNACKRYPSKPQKPECPLEPHDPRSFSFSLGVVLILFTLVFAIPVVMIAKDYPISWVCIYTLFALAADAFIIHQDYTQRKDYVNNLKRYTEEIKQYEQALERYQSDWAYYQQTVRTLNTQRLQTYRREKVQEAIHYPSRMSFVPFEFDLLDDVDKSFFEWLQKEQGRFELKANICVEIPSAKENRRKKNTFAVPILLRDPASGICFDLEIAKKDAPGRPLVSCHTIDDKFIVIRFSERQITESPKACYKVVSDICDSLSKRYEFVVDVDDNFVEMR